MGSRCLHDLQRIGAGLSARQIDGAIAEIHGKGNHAGNDQETPTGIHDDHTRVDAGVGSLSPPLGIENRATAKREAEGGHGA